MTQDPPSLTQQIEAVQWALRHAWETGKRAKERDSVIEQFHRGLEAAVETMKTWEFARETLR
jgi:hypothetical protein